MGQHCCCVSEGTAEEEGGLLRNRSFDQLQYMRSRSHSSICNRCMRATKGVIEEATDSKGRIFHAACLKCGHCSRSLKGEQAFIVDKITESGLPSALDPRVVYCKRHAQPRDRGGGGGGGGAADTAVVKGREAGRSHTLSVVRGDQTVQQIQDEIGHKIGLRMPTCAGCGGAFDDASEVLKMIGMEKYHPDCGPGMRGPGRAAAVVPRSPRDVAHAAPAQIVLRVHLCNTRKRHRYTGSVTKASTTAAADDASAAAGEGSGVVKGVSLHTFYLVKQRVRTSKGAAAPATATYAAEDTRTARASKRPVAVLRGTPDCNVYNNESAAL